VGGAVPKWGALADDAGHTRGIASVPPPEPEERDQSQPFFIVGVGASAGGLEALTAFLKALYLDSMAVVIVQHLAPKHESLLPTLLSRWNEAKVTAVEDGMTVEPGHIYVIPPNSDLAILQGVLHLMAPSEGMRAPHLPVDYFFRSLAEDQGSRSIGIVLSGTGSDGTFGLQSIKEAGGITFAQEPTSAKYDGMPRSAIDSGWADFTLAPEDIATELLRVRNHPYLTRKRASSPQAQESVGKLIVLMRAAFGNDLTYYKPTTMDRRIERRMALQKIESLTDYVKFVQGNPGELRLLYKDMLISVTNFFRDPESFETLKTAILSRMLESKETGGHIRFWIPACSTGEEAYSLAIALFELLGERAQEFRIQIFGTDVDESSIQYARRGLYPHNIALDVSPERLQRFFIKKENGYQITRRIRDVVVFSVQNVTRDAPFSRLDLVSCRNLLIYLRPSMQKRVLRIVHYSLLPTGYLMLGSSETVGDLSDYFAVVDRKNKIYARRHVAETAPLDMGLGVKVPEPAQPVPSSTTHRTSATLANLAERKILELYGPPGVLVNDDFDVVHIRGRTRGYLEPMPGAPSFNILRLARPDLHVELRRVLTEARSNNRRASVAARIAEDGNVRPVTIEVIPVLEPETKVRCFMVLFHEEKDKGKGREQGAETGAHSLHEVSDGPSSVNPSTMGDERTQELERELTMTKEYLQSAIEELESSNEELKSSNEELQSSNEELQSTNEELETSKEELQSSNEELTTVNDELHSRMGELQLTNDDLHNILSSMGSAMIIVGLDLRIRRFTQVAETLMNLVPGDVGRTASLLNAFVVGERIEKLAAQVIEKLVPVEKRIECANQRWYLLHISPYKTLDHAIKGAVIVLLDIDDARRLAEWTEEDRRKF
jgi:two-component system, chemotaxis family, CheB/CheR fusion protein